MLRHLFILCILCTNYLSAQELDDFLNIDRFHYYAVDMSGNLAKKGEDDLVSALNKVTPESIWKFVKGDQAKLKKLSDAHKYDELLRSIVKTANPNLSNIDLISSNYNFFKNKLNASYTFREADGLVAKAPLYNEAKPSTFDIPKLDGGELTLDADHYISNRQTRAILWDAIHNKRDIELYVEPLQDALSSIKSRGGEVVGEVLTLANNYNKNYLVYYPSENRYAHVITDISGTDRLHHLTKQLSVVKWGGKTGSERFGGKVNVFGDLQNLIEHETKELTKILTVLPKADHVVIGQKGAMERNVRSALKVEAVMKYLDANPTAIDALEQSHQKVVNKLKESGDFFESMYDASTWDKVYQKLESKIGEANIDGTNYNLDLNSHEIADVNIKTADGKIKRFRLVSNVWGNEATPIARALAETGHKNFTYIGTAGTLNSTYKVGDLVSPSSVQLHSGEYIDLGEPSIKPEGIKKGGKLSQVASLFDESQDWLAKQKNLGNDLVEMEVGYLAEVFKKKPGVKFNVFLLVSDAVGEEGETLDQASSSVRKKSQLNALHSIFKHEKATNVVPTSQVNVVDELVDRLKALDGSRNDLAIFQVKQKVRAEFGDTVPDDTTLKKFLQDNPSFSPNALNKRVNSAQEFLVELHKLGKEQSKTFQVDIGAEFMDGSYNAKNKFVIHYDMASKLDVDLVEQLYNSNPEFKKNLIIEAAPFEGGLVPIKSSELDKLKLLDMYNENALLEGGLLGSITKKGNLNYSLLPNTKHCQILFD